MIVKAVRTDKITAGRMTAFELVDRFLPSLTDGTVVVITSKVIALCENRVVPIASIDKEELIIRESDLYLKNKVGNYGYNFTYTKNTLVPASGIDESNSGGDLYVLWPKDPQASANNLRKHIIASQKLNRLGIIISDSNCMPARFGTLVAPIAHSGFLAVDNYVGRSDLFGRPFKVSRSSVAGGLAAAAGLVMGEGTEQVPIALIQDAGFVNFQGRDPIQKELDDFYLPPFKDNLFSPFLNEVEWQEGGHGKA